MATIPEQPKSTKNIPSLNTNKPDAGIKKANNPISSGIQKKTETSSKPSPAAGSFGSKLSQMNEMFKNKGLERNGPGGQRPSMMMGMPQSSKFGKGGGAGNSSGGGTSGIINEEPDKMRPGYDPAANLEKTLDAVVVVKKDKKKKKKPAFKG